MKIKKRISDERFVGTWNTSGSVAEVSRRLNRGIVSLMQRAERARSKGYNLADLPIRAKRGPKPSATAILGVKTTKTAITKKMLLAENLIAKILTHIAEVRAMVSEIEAEVANAHR